MIGLDAMRGPDLGESPGTLTERACRKRLTRKSQLGSPGSPIAQGLSRSCQEWKIAPWYIYIRKACKYTRIWHVIGWKTVPAASVPKSFPASAG
jgi:hypothetical protein